MTLRRTALALAAPVVLGTLILGGCAHAPPPPDALLSLQVTPPTAQVYVDDQPVHREPGGVRVPVRGGAFYRIEVRAAGHFPAYREVVVPAHGRRDLQIALRPDPDQARPALPTELLTGSR